MTGCAPGTRGALAVSFGNGLRSQIQNVFFLNLQTEPCDSSIQSLGGGPCQPESGVTVSFVVQPPPTAAAPAAAPSPSPA